MKALFSLILSRFLGVLIVSTLLSTAHGASHQYQWIIAGAGPSGLSTALFLLDAGVNPKDLLVLEMRHESGVIDEEAHQATFSKFAHGTRSRTIGLEQTTVDLLEKSGVKLQGSPLEAISFHYDYDINGALTGAQRRIGISRNHLHLIEGITNRQFRKTISISDLEKSLLKAFRAKGGTVQFRRKAYLKPVGNDVEVTAQSPDGNVQTYYSKFGVIADGKSSTSRTALGVDFTNVENDVRQIYLSADFNWPRLQGHNYRKGALHLFFDRDSKMIAYVGAAETGGSIGLLLPQNTVLSEQTIDDYRPLLRVIAQAIDLPLQNLKEPAIFSGELQQTEKVVHGNITIIGDAVRSTDPISANGVNVAILDAWQVAQFEKEKWNGIKKAQENLESNIKANTKWSIQGSLYFQEMIKWWLKTRSKPNPSILQSSVTSDSPASRLIYKILSIGLFFVPKSQKIKFGELGASIFKAPSPPKFTGMRPDCGDFIKKKN